MMISVSKREMAGEPTTSVQPMVLLGVTLLKDGPKILTSAAHVLAILTNVVAITATLGVSEMTEKETLSSAPSNMDTIKSLAEKLVQPSPTLHFSTTVGAAVTTVTQEMRDILRSMTLIVMSEKRLKESEWVAAGPMPSMRTKLMRNLLDTRMLVATEMMEIETSDMVQEITATLMLLAEMLVKTLSTSLSNTMAGAHAITAMEIPQTPMVRSTTQNAMTTPDGVWEAAGPMPCLRTISTSRETSTLQLMTNGTLGARNHNSNSSTPTTDGQEPSKSTAPETSTSDSGKDQMVKACTMTSISPRTTSTKVNSSETVSNSDPTSDSKPVMESPISS